MKTETLMKKMMLACALLTLSSLGFAQSGSMVAQTNTIQASVQPIRVSIRVREASGKESNYADAMGNGGVHITTQWDGLVSHSVAAKETSPETTPPKAQVVPTQTPATADEWTMIVDHVQMDAAHGESFDVAIKGRGEFGTWEGQVTQHLKTASGSHTATLHWLDGRDYQITVVELPVTQAQR